ncbi:hypothetical protein MN116_005001 [Schistosoma mekongi]|uniref:Uncharacterized protein n=1 Tax=Schistosoma mekongi TaxID=38744 RepID=A0AAE1ZCP5_SCHME|nr:hypothetical protein MN116_005001 [Schistosoma mekongi]
MRLICLCIIIYTPLIYCYKREPNNHYDDESFFSDKYDFYGNDYSEHYDYYEPGSYSYININESGRLFNHYKNNSSRHENYRGHPRKRKYNRYNDEWHHYDEEFRYIIFGGGEFNQDGYYTEGHGILGEENYAPTHKDPSKYDRYGNYIPDYTRPSGSPNPPSGPEENEEEGEEEEDEEEGYYGGQESEIYEGVTKPTPYVRYKQHPPHPTPIPNIQSMITKKSSKKGKKKKKKSKKNKYYYTKKPQKKPGVHYPNQADGGSGGGNSHKPKPPPYNNYNRFYYNIDADAYEDDNDTMGAE